MARAMALLFCFTCSAGAAAFVARPPAVTRLPAAAAAVRSSRVAMQVAEPPVKIPDFAPATPDSARATSPKGGKKYKLLLFNDNVNRREYVAKILVQSVPDVTSADAYAIMQKAHKSGLAVVGTWVLELCEVGRRRRLCRRAPRLPFTHARPTAYHPHSSHPCVARELTAVAPCWQAYCESLQSGGLIASVAEEED